MSVKISNLTDYSSAEVRRLVRATLRDLDADDVAVTVRYAVGRRRDHWGGRYREFWYPTRGEDRPQISARIPPQGAGEWPLTYRPYSRRDAPPILELGDWRELLVAVVAHEGKHHLQTPRHQYGRKAGRKAAPPRFREVEADWAAYRAVLRMRGELR